MGNKVNLGSVVYLHYRGGLKGEEPVDDRSEGEPLTVMVGDMKLPRGIEMALVGMDWNETTRVTRFYWCWPRLSDVALLLIWSAIFLLVGRALFVKKEV